MMEWDAPAMAIRESTPCMNTKIQGTNLARCMTDMSTDSLTGSPRADTEVGQLLGQSSRPPKMGLSGSLIVNQTRRCPLALGVQLEAQLL